MVCDSLRHLFCHSGQRLTFISEIACQLATSGILQLKKKGFFESLAIRRVNVCGEAVNIPTAFLILIVIGMNIDALMWALTDSALCLNKWKTAVSKAPMQLICLSDQLGFGAPALIHDARWRWMSKIPPVNTVVNAISRGLTCIF